MIISEAGTKRVRALKFGKFNSTVCNCCLYGKDFRKRWIIH